MRSWTCWTRCEGGGELPSPPAVTFLAPLDPFVWDRDLLRALFGFDYVWEVYVPETKRRWGYYVLPILFGDRLVGRIEPRIDRTARTVRILGAWWEDGFEPGRADGFVEAMRAALADYLRFAGARSAGLGAGPVPRAAAGRTSRTQRRLGPRRRPTHGKRRLIGTRPTAAAAARAGAT